MAADPRDFRRYLLWYAAAVAIVALPFVANYLFLLRASELSSYATIVERQFERRAIYASALNGNDLKYKLELLRRVRPEIMVIGSSRAMNLRDLVFTRPFLNAGGVSSNLLESETFVSEMLKIHKPKVVLYFVDYWWFSPKLDQVANRYLLDETSLSYTKLSSPFVWMRDGKISWDLYRDVLLSGRHANPYTRLETLGVFANTHSIGYRTDGSFFNSRGLKRDEGVIQYYWDELKAIEIGSSERAAYGLGESVDEAYVQRYLHILARLRQHGVQIIVVLPPVAPLYLKAVRSSAKQPYVEPLAKRLRMDIPLLYDFTDFQTPGNLDCEYTDGYHAGDTLSLRMLKEILKLTPNSPLKDYVDGKVLDSYIQRYTGQALILDQPSAYKATEFDFLGLGCRKSG